MMARKAIRQGITMAGKSLLMVVLMTAHLIAQVDRATLSGTITDTSGAIVPDAAAIVESPDTGLKREAQSATGGAYTFSQLPIGVYTLTISKPGFRSVRITDVRLRRGASSAWANTNPVLGAGEPGLETDTGRLKFGDGRHTIG